MFRYPVAILLAVLITATAVVDTFLPAVFSGKHYINQYPAQKTFKYLITDNCKDSKNFRAYEAKIISYYDSTLQQWSATKGKIKLYVAKRDSNLQNTPVLKYGDVIVSSDRLLPVSNYDSTFNYVRYMKHKRIYHICFVRSFSLTDSNQGNKIINAAKLSNAYLHKRLEKTSMGINQKNLAAALLLGDKQDLDKQIRNQFNTSGLAHILCVSGLHIMLIISFLSFLLKYILPAGLTFVYIRNALLVLTCWIIAFIVGLTPSAMRVALMLTLFIISRFVNLNSNPLNLLLTVAFVFLCFDPLLMYNLSFQLSFLSMAGILILKPILQGYVLRLTKPKRRFFQRIISDAAASTSAQLAVMPVLIMDFHAFPVMFLITNLIVLPLMQIILISLIIMLVFADIPLVCNAVEWVCNAEMSLLMFIASAFDKNFF
ncbi:MAG: ComEC/Rec2 family competence protein [Bacteroidales bacterium]|nr:ComEC/Rec2 family competence protein [Bacteroidales bacterium]